MADANEDPFFKLSEKMTEMQIEMMQHNWSEDERTDKASAFRNELFQCIADYRDWWINHSK